MAIRKGQVAKIVEGRGTLLAMLQRVNSSSGEKSGFEFSYEEGEGLRQTAFDPTGVVVETSDVIVVKGREFGSPVPARLVLFKDDQLDREIGPMVIA